MKMSKILDKHNDLVEQLDDLTTEEVQVAGKISLLQRKQKELKKKILSTVGKIRSLKESSSGFQRRERKIRMLEVVD